LELALIPRRWLLARFYLFKKVITSNDDVSWYIPKEMYFFMCKISPPLNPYSTLKKKVMLDFESGGCGWIQGSYGHGKPGKVMEF